MNSEDKVNEALRLLGEVLKQRNLAYELVIIGGGALLLKNLIKRPTLDIDAVARIDTGKWLPAKPLPEPLVSAVRDVANALGLEQEPRDEKDWLNGGPSILGKLLLPAGFAERTEIRRYGPLTIRIASRQDLITLKLWAATDTARSQRRAVDIGDLREIKPTVAELKTASRWCILKDGRTEIAVAEISKVLVELGSKSRDIIDE
ncbi:MAG: hypothetical protein JW841_00645 [Deltaproteobacteria bacterium]|nr:hypothetical protein [Deltaproteobacteria bacterium]